MKTFAFALLAVSLFAATVQPPVAKAQDAKEVLVYPTAEEGSLQHWLAISKLRFNAAYIGDSLSYDVFKAGGGNELTARPREGEKVQNQKWRKIHFSTAAKTEAAIDLYSIAGSYGYGLSICAAYLYSPVDRPNAIFAGSSDDGLKVILNGKKIWTNQIQRSPTYDGDQFPAPLKKGWNPILCIVDNTGGGHLLTGRFLDGGEPVKDLEISLDPPEAEAKRFPAASYNESAAREMRGGDDLRAGGKPAEAIAVYDSVLAKYPLADVAPRAVYAKAAAYYAPEGTKSLQKPAEAVAALNFLLERYPADLLAEYALIERAGIEESGLKNAAQAQASYLAFGERFPASSLAPKSQIEVGRLLGQQKKWEDAILTYRRVLKQYPQSDEVLLATIGMGDVYRESGEKAKAREQYLAAQTLAADWYENKYGIDVGKQAWLRGLQEDLRQKLA